MISLVEDWEVQLEQNGDKQWYYELQSAGGNLQVLVAFDKLGFQKQIDNEVDPLLTGILRFCKTRKCVKISETIRDDLFFQ